MKIICITGMPLSGKTTASMFLKEIGFHVISMGDVVRKLYFNEKSYAKKLEDFIVEKRNEMGKDYFARMCEEEIKKSNNITVIDGVRSIEEAEYFSKIGKVSLIAIHASPTTRFKRALERKREDDPIDFNEFKKRDMRELSFGLGNLISLSDYMIVNEYDKKYLKDNVLKIAERILNEN